MPEFEQIKTEYTDGRICGVDFGSKVRVLLRSPTKVMFTGYGLNLYERGARTMRDHHVAPDARRGTLEQQKYREMIVRHFGEGADQWALNAVIKRGLGTILVDGGGEAMPLPRVERAKAIAASYEEATAHLHIDPPAITQNCFQCGKGLRPNTTIHHLARNPSSGDHPKTVEECQRLTNHPVIAAHPFGSEKPREWWPYVSWFETWDVEDGYMENNFCSNSCAAEYGRRAAVEYAPLPVGGKVPPTKNKSPRPRMHYEEEVRYTEDGFKI